MSYLEKATHISLIAVSIIAAAVLVNDHVLLHHAATPPRSLVGSKIVLAGVEWPPQGRTIILVVSSHCRFCKASASLYHTLTTNRADGTPRIIVVSADPENEINTFLTEYEITVDQTIHAPPSRVGVVGTPTILIVNSLGRVEASFVGQLSPVQETKLRSIVAGSGAS